MSTSARANLETRRGSFTTWFTFIVGAPAGVGVLYLIEHGPWQVPIVQRYVHHLAEQAVVVIFFCCLAALLAKALGALKERYVQTLTLLPAWDGNAIPATDVRKLQQSLHLTWDRVRSTYLGRRIANILNFVASRQSANDLDDQMRTLADNDAMALDSSYALNRFLIWAMPILGFLGTVLGITDAIANITPADMEKGAEGISQGLTQAFDATALALSLTVVSMFINYLVEKFEQTQLESVDHYVDAELAHRFQRTQVAAGPGSPLDLHSAMRHLVEQQAQIWAASVEKIEQRISSSGQQEQWIAALQQALEATLVRFGQRMVETEKKLLERHQALLASVAKLAADMKDTGVEHQAALARLTDAIQLSIEMVTKVQMSEAHLLRLQEALNQNLALLANSATFEQAVESLTAAIHLLTTRVKPEQPRLAA